MIIRIPEEFFQRAKAAEPAAGRPQYRVGRRGFVGSALAAAALPLGRAWADANDVALPEQLSAIGLDGKPIAIARADIQAFRASLRNPARSRCRTSARESMNICCCQNCSMTG